MTTSHTVLRVGFALVGVAVFVAKRSYHGPFVETVASYGGNFAVSFAVYFITAIGASRHGLGRIAAAAVALLTVESFEVTNGFGVMANTFDPVDLLANAAGVATALAVDLAITRRASEPSR
jgi:hypothetical protein